MIDTIAFGFILLIATFGFIRGILSQLMGVLGLVFGFIWAPAIGKACGGLIQHQLGCTRFMADKFAIFLAGILIYVIARLMGFVVNRFLSKYIEGYKKFNRFGGAALGAIKGFAIVAVIFSFIALVPKDFMKLWFPKMLTSKTYLFATRYNPMGNQKMLERMRDFRAIVTNASKKEKLEADPELEKILKRHEMENAMHDKEFMKNLEEGDFEQLRQTENMEKLMNDSDMENLIDHLSKEKKTG